jgi:hypothetical protein
MGLSFCLYFLLHTESVLLQPCYVSLDYAVHFAIPRLTELTATESGWIYGKVVLAYFDVSSSYVKAITKRNYEQTRDGLSVPTFNRGFVLLFSCSEIAPCFCVQNIEQLAQKRERNVWILFVTENSEEAT